MSPVSYLTAPPRGVGPIVATLVTIVPMWDWAIWGALIVVGLAGTAALVLFALRTRQAWRDARDTPRDVLSRLDEFSRKAEAVAEKVAAASDTTGEPGASSWPPPASLAPTARPRPSARPETRALTPACG